MDGGEGGWMGWRVVRVGRCGVGGVEQTVNIVKAHPHDQTKSARLCPFSSVAKSLS